MIYLALILLGLCFGSFVNALVWRLYAMNHLKQMKVKAKDLSILHGRSMCTHCKHMLAWYDLLPVISWLQLGGKCRYCRKSISVQYPLVELLTAGLFVLSYSLFPYTLSNGFYQLMLAVWLAALIVLIALFVYDFRWMLLPNVLTVTLFGLALSVTFVHATAARDVYVFINAASGLLVTGGLFYVLFQVSKGKWIGGGDVKLGFSIGLLAGSFIGGLLLIFIASLLGTIYSIPHLSQKGSLMRRLPFGPFLITATIIVFLFGERMTQWYLAQFLFM